MNVMKLAQINDEIEADGWIIAHSNHRVFPILY